MLEHQRKRNAAGSGLTLTPGDSRRQGIHIRYLVSQTLVDEADDLQLYAHVSPAASVTGAVCASPCMGDPSSARDQTCSGVLY